MFSLSLSHRENLAAVVVLTFRLGGRVNVAVAVVVVVAVSCYFIDQMIEASYGGNGFTGKSGPTISRQKSHQESAAAVAVVKWFAWLLQNQGVMSSNPVKAI